MASVVSYEKRDAIAVLTLQNPPVNALNQACRRALLDLLNAALADPGVEALVVTGEGRQFSAGADINEFGNATRPPPHLREVVSAFDASAKPIVAAIHGVAFGGALELAMACHYRVATVDAKVALSEVKFGIIPGAGGTQLLPRLVGPVVAFKMITTGDPIDGRTAAAVGLVDLLVDGDPLLAAIDFAQTMAARRPLPRASQRSDLLAVPFNFVAAAKTRLARRPRAAPAPQLALEAIAAALELPFEAGIQRERELWAQAAASPEAEAMRYVFKAERTAAKVQDLPEGTSAAKIRRVAVVGTGTMGIGIAIALANAGMPVTLIGRRQQGVDAACTTIARHYAGAVEKGQLSEEEMESRVEQIAVTTSSEDLAAVDLVIEAVVEDMAAKRAIFASLAEACRPDAVLATNTSSLDVDAIANGADVPGRIVGIHFFAPAHATRLVEVVRGAATTPATVAAAVSLVKRLGKSSVVVRARDGLVSTRMFLRYLREANQLLLDGASPHEVDAAMVRFGMAMGPLAVSDLAGIDLIRTLLRADKRPTGDHRGPDAIADRLVQRGRRGQKTNRGYYSYELGGRAPSPDPEVDDLIVDVAKAFGRTRRSMPESEMVERCVRVMVDEGARILNEGVVSRASDLDVIWVDAYGFPRHRGGPMYRAERNEMRQR